MIRSGLRVPASDQTLPHGLGLVHAPALRLQRGAHEAADLALVLDRMATGSGSAMGALRFRLGRGGRRLPSGSVKVNRAPPPGRFAATILP